MLIGPSAGRLQKRGFQLPVEVAPDFGDPFVAKLAEERGGFVIFENGLPAVGFKQRDAERRIERRAQIMTRHRRGGDGIANLILDGVALMPGYRQQIAVVALEKHEKLGSVVYKVLDTLPIAVAQHDLDIRVEYGKVGLDGGSHLWKGAPGGYSDVFYSDGFGGDRRGGHDGVPFENGRNGRGIILVSRRCLIGQDSKEQVFSDVITEQRSELAGQRKYRAQRAHGNGYAVDAAFRVALDDGHAG